MEKAYFQKLKSDIDIARSYMKAGEDGQARAVLESIVDVDGAVLLLYRNLGELWADLASKLEDLRKDLRDLGDRMELYHDELNEKIDEINNYIMALIRDLDERKQDKLIPGYGISIEDNVISTITTPVSYTTQQFSYNLLTDIGPDDLDDEIASDSYGFYIRNVRFYDNAKLRNTPAAITLREAAIGTDAMSAYLQPIKGFMQTNKIKGVELLSRTSVVFVGAERYIYEVTNNAAIYNRPAVGSINTGATSGGIYLHTEPLKETFVDCSKFAGTRYYIFKRLSFNLIPETDMTASINMKTFANDYLFAIPRFDEVTWSEHQIIEE